MLGIFQCRGFDDEMRAVVSRNLEARGINLHPITNITEVLLLECVKLDLILAKKFKKAPFLVVLILYPCLAFFFMLTMTPVP